MAYNVVTIKIASLGFCCPLSYFYAVRNIDTVTVAKELKVAERTVRRWRAAYRYDKMLCVKARDCFLTARPSPAKCPDSAPALAADLDLALSDEHA